MPSAATAFTLGIVTATAIAAGFAGAFMESVGTQRSTDALLRERAKPVVVGAPSNMMPQPVPVAVMAAPSTSGFAPLQSAAPAAMQSATPAATRLPSSPLLPSAAAVPVSKPTNMTAIEPTQPAAAAPEQAAKKNVRKHSAKAAKRQRDLDDDRYFAAQRERSSSGGLFGLFR